MNRINYLGGNWFDVLRNAEGVEGGGAGDGGTSGAVASEGAAAAVAGVTEAAPASTFLTEPKAAAPEETPAEGAAPIEAPAAFDVAAATLPEGVEIDPEVGKSFAELLADPELSPQERGQKLLDLHTGALASLQEKAQQEWTEASTKNFNDMNEAWRNQIKELPEFKGNPDAEAGKVMQALRTVGAGADFFTALDLTGAGNNPAILQVLHRLTAPHFEGGAVSGQGKPASARRLGDNIYTSATKP